MVQDLFDLRNRQWKPRNGPSSTPRVENRQSTSTDEQVPSLHTTVEIVSGSDEDVGSEPCLAKYFGCESQQLKSQILATKQQVITCDETCGFELDMEFMKGVSKQLPFRPFYIPNRDQTKQPVSIAAAKPQVHFAASDIRYRNKPMSGYTTTCSDGVESTIKSESLPASTQLIADKKNEVLRRSAASEAKSKQTTPTIPPPTEITQIVTAFLASGQTATGQTNSAESGQLVAEKQVVKQPTENPSTVSPDFLILSSVTKEVNYNQIVITGIANSDCGRVIGRNGSNIKRLEKEYGVKLSFRKENLHITEGDVESRMAACSDVIQNLPVTIECRKLDLSTNVFSSSYLLKQLNFKHNVRISRQSPENKFVTIWGTLDRCRTVYQVLQAGSR